MKNLSQLSKTDLLSRAKFLADEDKRISLLLMDVFAECERRMIHLEMGYSSLWEFAVKFLQLSESSAQIRISAMRLGRENPQVIESLRRGELSLSNAAQLQSFFREKKKSGENLTSQTKNEIIQSVTGLSKRECGRTLLALSPHRPIPMEKERQVTGDLTELKLILNEVMIEKLKRLKDLLSHSMPHATYAELLEYMTDETLAQLEKKKAGKTSIQKESEWTSDLLCPEKQTQSLDNRTITPPIAISPITPPPRKYIPVGTRRQIWRQAQGRCQFISQNGLRCSSRHRLEIDHTIPLALGGDNTQLRLLCKNHNLQQAVHNMGQQYMKNFIPSIR